MIELAAAEEQERPCGVTYSCQDASKPEIEMSFDLAMAAWLLVYCRSRSELADMCQGIASWLKPYGRLCTIITNPDVVMVRPDYFAKYGFRVEVENPCPVIEEGTPIKIRIDTSIGELAVENFYLPMEAYTEALEAAGFYRIVVHDLELDPAASSDDATFYNDFLLTGAAKLIEAYKRG